ncbi:Smr domain protein [Piscinibacter sakaiensis]|uniref:Smr domain protein n=1 Tax=Piscinibacter sakaiensis TaxID=1547922 RepID=A0A0K8P5P0_PISS1|nr:Smr domain protein [Piscinibacter sakaiensis]
MPKPPRPHAAVAAARGAAGKRGAAISAISANSSASAVSAATAATAATAVSSVSSVPAVPAAAGPARAARPGAAAAPPLRAASLAELAPLRQALADARRAQAAREAAEAARRAREEQERTLFARSVGPVLALRRGAPAAPPARPLPPAEPRQRERDEQAVLREALSDEFDAESLLETDESLSWRRADIGPDVVRRLRRGVWAIQADIDLHGLRRDEAREALGGFLRAAERRGLRCIRVVHGKGLGSPGRQPVLKGKVRQWLVQREEVIAFAHARAADGGHGAVIVLLRPQGGEPPRSLPRAAAAETAPAPAHRLAARGEEAGHRPAERSR